METSVRATRIFSHNDEEHGDQALVLALSQGVGQIEIDTWLWEVDGDLLLLAAHMESEIRPHDSLARLYLDPLMAILDRHNPDGVHLGKWTGLYASDPTATVSIAIDVKNEPLEMWDHLVVALEPFRRKGYLTAFDPNTQEWTDGPLRIIGTGDTPLERVLSMSPRYIFLDSKLHDLVPPLGYTGGNSSVADPTVAPMASGYFLPRWTAAIRAGDLRIPLREMEAQVQAARSMGVEPRYWGAPREEDIRRTIWQLQLDAGVDWLSGDDLEEMTTVWWSTRRKYSSCP